MSSVRLSRLSSSVVVVVVPSEPGPTLWMRNAFDEDYFLHNWPLQGSGQATPAPPRTYGVTITWRND